MNLVFISISSSKSQPFCDGSHKGTGIAPKKFTVSEAKKYYLCGCKQTENSPFCDGTHKKEKGIKKYNEFLLKKNGELKESLANAEKKVQNVSFVSLAALIIAGIYLFKAYKS